MGIVFEVKKSKAIFDMKEFCRFKNELTYVGRFANKETSEVIQGTIFQYNGKYYTNEVFLRSGVGWSSADNEGMITTSVSLFDIDFVPENAKPLSDCSIRIDIWNIDIDDEGPISQYAFYESQLEDAKKVVCSNKDVDIFVNKIQIAKSEFLKF